VLEHRAGDNRIAGQQSHRPREAYHHNASGSFVLGEERWGRGVAI